MPNGPVGGKLQHFKCISKASAYAHVRANLSKPPLVAVLAQKPPMLCPKGHERHGPLCLVRPHVMPTKTSAGPNDVVRLGVLHLKSTGPNEVVRLGVLRLTPPLPKGEI